MDNEPFIDDHAHLRSELSRLDTLLHLQARRVLRAAGIKPKSLEAIRALFACSPGDPPWRPIEGTPEIATLSAMFERQSASLKTRVAATLAAGRPLRLAALAERCGLSGLDQSAVLLALAPELDVRYEAFYAWLHNDDACTRPSVQLTLDLFAADLQAKIAAREGFVDPLAPLRRRGLCRLADNPLRPAASPLRRELVLSPGVVRWLSGGPALDPEFAASVARLTPPPDAREALLWPAALGDLFERVVARAAAGDRAALWLTGPAGTGRKAFAKAVCGALGRPLYVVDGPRAAALDRKSFGALVDAVGLACLLDEAALCFTDADVLGDPERSEHHAALLGLLAERGPALTFLTGAKPWFPDDPPRDLPPLQTIRLTAPDTAQRIELWRAALGGADERDIASAAEKFRFTPGRIRGAAATSRGLALGRGAGSPGEDDMMRAGRSHATPKLGSLAALVDAPYTWDDLILAPDRFAQLREIVRRSRHAGTVLDAWGFGHKHSNARGIVAQFWGPPGTGKTMAAAIIAREIGCAMYRIDISQVVSKYIGETEKQLDRVFTEAESTDVVLFFDEADALFGKRTAVSDAHDRYANIETAFLLQRIESYPGLIVLATNLHGNIDQAFLRRVQVAVEFPAPDAAERERIWGRIWPREAPLDDDVDLRDLAVRLDVTGGNIRNIALNAAYQAAEDGGRIGLRHILGAAKAEYRKLGKLFAADLFGARSQPSSGPSNRRPGAGGPAQSRRPGEPRS